MTLNGTPMHGFPIVIQNDFPGWAYKKFIETTNRYYNNRCSKQMSLAEFTANFIFAHKFEAETSSTGWLGVDLQLDAAYSTAMSMGMYKDFK